MLNGQLPYDKSQCDHGMGQVQVSSERQQRIDDLVRQLNVSDAAKEVVSGLLVMQEDARMTLDRVATHPWLAAAAAEADGHQSSLSQDAAAQRAPPGKEEHTTESTE